MGCQQDRPWAPGGCRGPRQTAGGALRRDHSSRELGAAASPRAKFFPYFKFPPWHEHIPSEITVGGGGRGEQGVGKGSVDGGREPRG